jgi:hypothetical protein
MFLSYARALPFISSSLMAKQNKLACLNRGKFFQASLIFEIDVNTFRERSFLQYPTQRMGKLAISTSIRQARKSCHRLNFKAFFMISHFHPSLMHAKRGSTRVGSGLGSKYYTRLQVTVSDKHSSFLITTVKNIIVDNSRSCFIKLSRP